MVSADANHSCRQGVVKMTDDEILKEFKDDEKTLEKMKMDITRMKISGSPIAEIQFVEKLASTLERLLNVENGEDIEDDLDELMDQALSLAKTIEGPKQDDIKEKLNKTIEADRKRHQALFDESPTFKSGLQFRPKDSHDRKKYGSSKKPK